MELVGLACATLRPTVLILIRLWCYVFTYLLNNAMDRHSLPESLISMICSNRHNNISRAFCNASARL